jgi:serine phosphatase RsbU (regulator of sigma subunit)
MNKITYFIIIILISTFCFGQKAKVDSLNQKLRQEQNDFKKLSILSELCKYCELSDNLKYATNTINIVNPLKKSTKDTSVYNQLLRYEADAYNYIGVYYGENNFYNKNESYNIEKSIIYYNKAIKIYKEIKLWDKINETYSAIENQYMREGDSYSQLQNYKSAIDFGKLNNNKNFVARFTYRLATFYARIGDTTKAMQYANDGILLEKEINDPKRLAKGYELGADLYFKIHQYKKAIEYYNKALIEHRKNKDSLQFVYVYLGLGNTYAGLNDYENANKNLNHALSCLDSLGNHEVFYTEILIELGRLEYKFNNYKVAANYHQLSLSKSEKLGFPGGIAVSSYELAKDLFASKKNTEAKKHIEQSLAIKKQIGSVENVMRDEKLCYQIDSALGDFKSAFLHYASYTKLQKKLNLEEIKKATIQEDLQAKFKQEKEKELLIQQKKEAEIASEFKQQKMQRNGLIFGFLVLCIIAVIIFRNYNIKKKYSNDLVVKNNEILLQKKFIEEKQHEILDSITYAKRLQHAILPPQEFINSFFSENFILYKPKDIVAGDFYWAEKIDNLFFIAAADSTGHGVPGAMVSVVCSNALNRSVKEFKHKTPGSILDKTRELVIETFEKSVSDIKDGMDVSLLCIDMQNQKIFWSGANNPLWYVQNNTLIEIKANKQPIGKTDDAKSFTTHEIEYKINTTFYLFTDGLADQFGGPKGKKFKYKQFQELLISIDEKKMDERAKIISGKIEEWKGSLEQVDDICVIGIKI